MEARSFTFDEATEICDDFEDLKDTEFRYGPDLLVVDDIYISMYGSAEPAVESEAASGYDVVIAAAGTDGSAYYVPIRDYVAVHGVQYNFPE